MRRSHIPLALIAGAVSGSVLVALGNLAATGQLQVYLPIRAARAAIPTTLVAVLLVAMYVGALPASRKLDIRRAPPWLFYFLFGGVLWLCIATPIAQGLLTHYGFAIAAALAASSAALAAFVGVRLFTLWCIKRGMA